MAKIDKEYHKLLNTILSKGYIYEDPNRKGVNRIQIPSYTIKHNFKDGFPAITTKKLYWKGVVGELIWFLRGDTNIKYLADNNISIWNKDAYNHYCDLRDIFNYPKLSFDEFIDRIKRGKLEGSYRWYKLGDLGKVYGAQWRNWNGNISNFPISIIPETTKNYTTEELLEQWHKHVSEIGISFIDTAETPNTTVDQLSNLIKGLKENPMGTKHIVTAWNPAELDQMALPPCHWSFEILVEPINYQGFYSRKAPRHQFTLKWHQRSVDTFLGLPFNITSYALLAQIIGKMTNMIPKGIEGNLSNVHIYEPHLDAVKEQLSRDVGKHTKCELDVHPEFEIATNAYNLKVLNLDEYLSELRIDMFKLKNYTSEPRIPAEMLPYNK